MLWHLVALQQLLISLAVDPLVRMSACVAHNSPPLFPHENILITLCSPMNSDSVVIIMIQICPNPVSNGSPLVSSCMQKGRENVS